MADKITIYNFIAWLRNEIAPEKISALLTEYGYTDDSDEVLIDALRRYAFFSDDLGKLLAQSLKENKAELNRSIGGITQTSNSLSIDEWKSIVRRGLVRADGVNVDSGKDKSFDWNALVGGVLGTVTSIFGKNPTTTTTSNSGNGSSSSSTGSSYAIWIIVAVVIIAMIAILWMALSKQKK